MIEGARTGPDAGASLEPGAVPFPDAVVIGSASSDWVSSSRRRGGSATRSTGGNAPASRRSPRRRRCEGERASAVERSTQRAALHELGDRITVPALAAARTVGVPVVEVVGDEPAQALVADADRHDAAVIVAGTGNDGPLRGALLGSVAHELLQPSTRPVPCVPGVGA